MVGSMDGVVWGFGLVFFFFFFLQLTNTCSSPACWKCWLNWVFAKDIKMIGNLKKKKISN